MHRKAQTLKNEYILHSVQTLRVSETLRGFPNGLTESKKADQ